MASSYKNKFDKKNFLGDIKKDIILSARMAMNECAKIASKELQNEYITIIDCFYNDYEPEWYVRGYGLQKSFKPYYENDGHGNYSGGIIISADRMKESDYTYKRSNNVESSNHYKFLQKEVVLDVTVFQGFHGKKSIAVTSPSPLKEIIRIRDNLAKNPERIMTQAWRNVIKQYFKY